MKTKTAVITILFSIFTLTISAHALKLKKTIRGQISPKSVVHSGTGLFFAQNMMYNHTITVYNRQYKLVKTISDRINLSDYGYKKHKGSFRGAPVECAFSHGGDYAWVSQYCMFGRGFHNHGHDKGGPNGNYDKSFVYKINTKSLKIEDVIKVGAVPKFVAVTPDNKYVLVTNWCTWDLSVIDIKKNDVIKSIKLGRFPRGIVVSPNGDRAYVAVMGSYDVAVVSMKDFSVRWIKRVGHSPRHLNIDPGNRYLYATCNGEGTVAKIDLKSQKVVKKIVTGRAPRSMIISDDGRYLYVVNYKSATMSKVRTSDMKVMQSVKTNPSPIGITYDPKTREVWVACYGGTIMVFVD